MKTVTVYLNGDSRKMLNVPAFVEKMEQSLEGVLGDKAKIEIAEVAGEGVAIITLTDFGNITPLEAWEIGQRVGNAYHGLIPPIFQKSVKVMFKDCTLSQVI